MAGLFDRKKVPETVREVHKMCTPQSMSSGTPLLLQDKQKNELGIVAESVSVLPNLPQSSERVIPADSATPKNSFELDDDEINFKGEKSPTDAILEMSGDDDAFAVKGVTPFPPAFMAAQVQADYHDNIFGEGNDVSVMLRNLCRWASRYNSSKKGDRAKLMFSALGAEKQAEFQLEKEAKGMLPH